MLPPASTEAARSSPKGSAANRHDLAEQNALCKESLSDRSKIAF
jgi:hypothetical protein